MNKTHAARILGGLTLIAVLLLTGPGRANVDIFSPDFLAVLRQACNDSANDPSACIALVELLKEVGKPGDFEANLLKGFDKGLNLNSNTSCDACVLAVQHAETAWAEASHVPGGVQNVIRQACIDHFQDSTEQQQCLATFDDTVPPLVEDVILGEHPPVPVCRELNYCPAN